MARQLASLGKSDREKVRAIFRWITEHIDYNVTPFGQRKNVTRQFYKESEDSSLALPPLNERIAAKVLNTGVAFCEGYSRLFKTLCDHAGIRAEVIYGYARTNSNRRFAVNHTWNSVFIDSSWYLLDVTWASGFVTYGNQYIRQYNDFYFLTHPDEFIREHYPEDLQWTLLKDPPVYREYGQSPFRYSGYIKAGVSSYFPARGVIDVAVGDTIAIELKASKEVRNFFVSESPVPDTTQLVEISPVISSNQKLVFKYNITTTTGEWLYVFCNEELALRYKLNVKKEIVKANDSMKRN
ncbi:MAG TPA: transglutaminase domain-containing protein [Chitinophagaceae bacterium]|nr:transglutaminase domain-containing protein [Chitinophagaceae bacterium]